MNRRAMLGLSLGAIGSIFVPQYGRWHRQGSGLLVADSHALDAAYHVMVGPLMIWDPIAGTSQIVNHGGILRLAGLYGPGWANG